MYCGLLFPVIVNQSRQHWIIFKTCKNKTLSSKESEPLINNTYYFLALFTIYVMHEIMNSILFIPPYQFPSYWFAFE
jgi:hypothetical protein